MRLAIQLSLLRNPRFWLIVLPAAVYANSLFGEFVYDDKELTIENNPALTGEAGVWDILQWDRPMREFTYMLDHAVWGFQPFGYHLQNVAWHIANVLLFFALLNRLGFSLRLSFGAALLFSIHPANTESTAWISGRKELLCLFFELSACLFFVRSLEGKRLSSLPYTASLFCAALALLSKQSAVALPVFLALCAWFYRRNHAEKIEGKKIALSLLFPALIVIGFILFRYPILDQLNFTREKGTFYDPSARDVSYTLLSALLTPFATFLKTLWLCVWPMNLTVDHAFEPVVRLSDPRWMAGAAVMAGLLAAAFAGRKTRPGFLFGLIWLLAAWGPVCGVAPVAYLIADRYLYIPCIGFCLAATAVVMPWLKMEQGKIPQFSLLIGIAVCLFYSARTVARNFDWKDDISLWQSAVRADPMNPKAHTGLGNAYFELGDYETAYRIWSKSLQIDPDQPRIWVNWGNAEKRQGRLDASDLRYRKALELLPQYGAAHFNLALLLEQQGRIDEALKHFKLAAEHLYHRTLANQRKGLAHYHIARILFDQGDRQAAGYHIAYAEKLAPHFAPIYLVKGMLHIDNPEVMRSAFEKAIQLDPGCAEAYYNLGLLEWRQGSRKKAEQLWEKAIKLNPELKAAIDHAK
ncbi:MAG: tetratricopeptide repeat protein [Candidatus Omnitrophica bacterium]|nr:tetratricopeptide repeat protein [Candidatus Omnitrophota bacterium]